MQRLMTLSLILVVLSGSVAACASTTTPIPTPEPKPKVSPIPPTPTLCPSELAEKEWTLVAEALQGTGEILFSIDPSEVRTAQALASAYHDAGARLADSSDALAELPVKETAKTVASMAAQFRQAGNALEEEDFAAVADILSDSAGSLEILVGPVFETDELALLEPTQNAIFMLNEQAGTAQSLADLSPWLAELEELLDFYDTHTPEELQELAWAFLEEVQDPEEQARFGLYDAEEVEALKNLSQLLTTPEFEEWVQMAKSDLSGWLNEASQETFVMQAAEMGHWLIETGNVMTILVSQARLGAPATHTSGRNSSAAEIVPLFASHSTPAASVAAKNECPKVCINRQCIKQVAFTPGPLNPDQDGRMMRLVNAPRTTMPFGGTIIRRALNGLKATWMQNRRVVVWVKVRWEHCELKRCWFSKCKRWVKHESAWREVKPPKDFTVPGLTGWQGRIQWDERVTNAMAKAIDKEVNRISPCPTPTPTRTPTPTSTPTSTPTPTPTTISMPTMTPTFAPTPTPMASIELEDNIDRLGMDYSNFDLPEADPELCWQACLKDSRCAAFTYVKPGIQASNARCWLKYGVPQPLTDGCCISGVKPSEP